MSLTVKSVTNPQWADAAHTNINCVVEFNEISGPHPFGATSTDPMPYGAQIFDDLVAGKYGAIAAYVAP